jgi:2-(1,2-epoxy-1,2-dihydrophenyl)acetyl-CoA isomerase
MTSNQPAEYVQIENGVLRITISTPAKGNSLDFGGVNEGTAALRALDAHVGAVLLVGSGKNFCAGGDVRAFASAPSRGEFLTDLATQLHDFIRALDSAAAPVVVGVQGWAAGAGMSLVCGADIAIGGPSTKLRPAYPGIGFTPDGGMSWNLPRIVGAARAKEIILTDAVIDSEDAVRLGILSRVVADDDVAAEALRVAESIAAGPRSAHAGIKALLALSATSSLSDQLDRETAAIAASAESPTGREGVDAFVEKRKPDFSTQ